MLSIREREFKEKPYHGLKQHLLMYYVHALEDQCLKQAKKVNYDPILIPHDMLDYSVQVLLRHMIDFIFCTNLF